MPELRPARKWKEDDDFFLQAGEPFDISCFVRVSFRNWDVRRDYCTIYGK